MADWSSLPDDILNVIAKVLLAENPADYDLLRYVCTSWRSAVPPRLPWLMLSYNGKRKSLSFYKLSEEEVLTIHVPEVRHSRILGSADGWLVLVNDVGAKDRVFGQVRLFDPFTKAQLHLPTVFTVPGFSICGEKLQGYIGDGEIDDDSDEDEDDYGIGNLCGFIDKAIMLHAGDAPHDRIVAASFYLCGTVGFARPGDDRWTIAEEEPINDEWTFGVMDIVNYRGRVYAVNYVGIIAALDIGPPAKIKPLTPRLTEERAYWYYLVESAGELLIITRTLQESSPDSSTSNTITGKFEVFRVDHIEEEKPMLTRVQDLGDRILFIGTNHSMSSPASDFPGRKGNCIYFTTRYAELSIPDEWGGTEYPFGDDFGVFDLKDGSITSLPYYSDIKSPRFLWPPPIWFTPRVLPEKSSLPAMPNPSNKK